MEIEYLFLATFISGLILGILFTYYLMKGRMESWFKEWKVEEENRIRKDVIKRSRASLKGKIGEQMAPLLPIFNYEPSDARFIGSPVDYVIFEGLSRNEPEEIIFADVKIGKEARLNSKQRNFRRIVEEGRISWETIHLDEFSSE